MALLFGALVLTRANAELPACTGDPSLGKSHKKIVTLIKELRAKSANFKKCDSLEDYYKRLNIKVDGDRYLDGNALGDRVAADLKNSGAKFTIAGESHSFLLYSLFNGNEIDSKLGGKNKSFEALDAWINSASVKDQSITPEILMNKALALSSNDVQEALVLCWNYLRQNLYQDSRMRNTQNFVFKLYDITGEWPLFDDEAQEVKEKGQPVTKNFVRGDKFSAWYHFFGTALHEFARQQTNWRTNTHHLVKMEERWHFGWDYLEDSKKRIEIDNAGADFGKRLYRNLTNPNADLKKANSEHSLKENPTVYGPSWDLKAGQKPRDFKHPDNDSLPGLTYIQQSLLLRAALDLNSTTFSETERGCILEFSDVTVNSVRPSWLQDNPLYQEYLQQEKKKKTKSK